MWGPLGRLVAQVGLVVVTAFGRAAFQAYKEAASRGSAHASRQLGSKMHLEEARKILGIDSKDISTTIVQQRFDKMHSINMTRDDYPGSPYLQSKIINAKTILEEHLGCSNKSSSSQEKNIE
eukprot:GHVL01018470.1.p1 GENE.GHVL01018470.1~~GHVL01018470.1.p1  ORF type:complete len:129 (+),score=20.28 GHVL01018470.1:22-387(+)